MTIFLAILCVLLLAALVISLRFNLNHGKIIIDVEDALTEALDVCDKSYSKIVQVLELPVALATPEVRHVLNEIENVRNAVLYVSNVLAEPYGGVTEEKVNDSQDQEKAD